MRHISVDEQILYHIQGYFLKPVLEGNKGTLKFLKYQTINRNFNEIVCKG